MILVYKASQFTKNVYKVGEVADFLNITTKTVRTYIDEGKIKASRTDGKQRVVAREDLLEFLNQRGLLYNDTTLNKKDVIYARVSSHEQKEKGDLDRQALFLVENVKDLQNPIILKEVGSGLNDNRKLLQQLLVMVCDNEVRNVYVTYKDRLTRFGYHYLETMFKAHDVSIIVVKDEEIEKSVQEELAEDMMSLIASFSGKLHGLRSKKNKSK